MWVRAGRKFINLDRVCGVELTDTGVLFYCGGEVGFIFINRNEFKERIEFLRDYQVTAKILDEVKK